MPNDTAVKTNEITPAKAGSNRLRNFSVQILAFLGAIVLWFYVMGVNSPTYEKTFNDIPVTVIGSDNLRQNYGYTILSGTDIKIDITIQGRRSDINKLVNSDIQIQADVSDINTVGQNVCSLIPVLPNGLSTSSMSSSNISLYIDKSISKSIPVKVTHTGYITTGLILGAYEPNPASVTVEGPENIINTIEGAYADLELDKIEGSINARQKLVLKNSDGEIITNPYINLRTTEVDVYIPVYIEKTIPLTIAFVDGVYPVDKATIVIEPAAVLIRGVVEKMSDINKITLDVHEALIDGEYQASIPISLPAGIENKSGKSSAKVTISLPAVVSRIVSVNNITYIEVPVGLDYTISPNSQTVLVKLKGESAALINFDYMLDLTATVDLSSLEGKNPGVYQLPVTIDTDFENSGIYSFGTYYIDIIVR